MAERLTPEDRHQLRRIDRDPAVTAFMGGVRTPAATDAYLERNLEHWVEYGFGIWMLRDPDSGALIGRAGLRHILVEQSDEVELAYALLNLPQEPLDLLSRKTAGRAGVTRAFVVGEHELRALR